MTKTESVINFMLKAYQNDSGSDKFQTVFRASSVNYTFLMNHKKSGVISKVEPVAGSPLAFHDLPYGHRTGVYKVTLNNGSFFFFAYDEMPYFNNKSISICVGPSALIHRVQKMALRHQSGYRKRLLKREKEKQEALLTISKPGFYKIGLVKVEQTSYPTIELNRTKPTHIPAVHPVIKDIYEDMYNFFDNIKRFRRYGQPGVRKIMLVGPPGTGKTTLANKMVRELQRDYAIMITTKISDVYNFQLALAKSSVKGIVFWEDAESSMQDNAEVLNFLDGILQPKIKGGCYVIMSTNHPHKIAGRILKRPGRIDRFMKMGVLHGQDALDCFKVYAPKSFKYDDQQLIQLISGNTGAQIKEIVMSSLLRAASQGVRLSFNTIAEIIDIMTKGYREVEEIIEESGRLLKEQPNGMGFSSEVTKSTEKWEFAATAN